MTLEQYYGEKTADAAKRAAISVRYDCAISGGKDGGRDSADSLYKFSNQSAGKPDTKI